MKGILLLLTIFLFAKTKAATVDTVTIYSNALHKNKKCVVIKPDSYTKKKTRFPVVYLLHGHAGDFSNWISKVPQLKSYVDDSN